MRTFHTTQPPEPAPSYNEWMRHIRQQARQQQRFENFRAWVANKAPSVPALNQSPSTRTDDGNP